MSDFVVILVKDLVSKSSGKPFRILQIKNMETGEVGDFPIFSDDVFSVGDILNFDIVLNYRYQWTAELKHKQ